jgi:hypothetical protein
LNVNKLPTSASAVIARTKTLLLEDVDLYIHRITPLERTSPLVPGNPVGFLCVARENIHGGDVITKLKTYDVRMGDLVTVSLDTFESFYIHPVQPIDVHMDAYMDVIWFIPIK